MNTELMEALTYEKKEQQASSAYIEDKSARGAG